MPTPVISVAQMREWEKATWAAKRTPAQVISRVGHIVTSRAKQLTRPGDLIVILAGKGHETYQVLKDRTIPFDDRNVAREVLKGYGYRKPGEP